MRNKWKSLPKKTRGILLSLLSVIGLGAVLFLCLLSIVLFGSRDQIHGTAEVMIILGCQVTETGPAQSLEDRLVKALEYLEEFPDIAIIVSGGQGSNEPCTEAEAMALFLIEAGIAPEQIYQEGNSRNTHQNLSYSRTLMEEEGITGDVLIVSSGFHLARASMLWQRVGGDPEILSLLAADVTDMPSWIKSHIREPLALVKSFIFDHGQVVLP